MSFFPSRSWRTASVGKLEKTKSEIGPTQLQLTMSLHRSEIGRLVAIHGESSREVYPMKCCRPVDGIYTSVREFAGILCASIAQSNSAPHGRIEGGPRMPRIS